MQQDIEITSRDTEPAAGGCCGGGCCGSNAETTTVEAGSMQTFEVDGMTCDHCVSAVRGEIAEIDGVRSVAVDLVAGGRSRVTVSADAPIDSEAIQSAVDEAGYALVR